MKGEAGLIRSSTSCLPSTKEVIMRDREDDDVQTEEPVDETEKPGIVLVTAQGGKPHLPV